MGRLSSPFVDVPGRQSHEVVVNDLTASLPTGVSCRLNTKGLRKRFSCACGSVAGFLSTCVLEMLDSEGGVVEGLLWEENIADWS